MEKFEITKEQILKVSEWGNSKDNELIKSWFPDAFKKELEVGKWYKGNVDFESLIFITEIEKRNNRNNIHYYGFIRNYRNKDYIANTVHEKSLIEATEQEVKTALINEAKKIGFGSIGVKFIDVFGDLQTSEINGFDFWNLNNSNVLLENKFNISVSSCGGVIFNKGKWATIIETITKEEAEKLLNKKII